jgi:hypothetical protein
MRRVFEDEKLDYSNARIDGSNPYSGNLRSRVLVQLEAKFPDI